MKCNVKGHRLAGNVFGVVYPTFRTAEQRKGKYRETDEVRRKLEERQSCEATHRVSEGNLCRKLMELLHANFAERD